MFIIIIIIVIIVIIIIIINIIIITIIIFFIVIIIYYCYCQDVTSLAILPDGRIVSGSRDSSIKIWNSETIICEKTLIGHTQVSDDNNDCK